MLGVWPRPPDAPVWARAAAFAPLADRRRGGGAGGGPAAAAGLVRLAAVPLGIPENAWIIGKDELALPRVVHALALALIVARLTPREAPWMHTMLARWLAAAGRHQLHVFCLGLFLSWAVTAVFRLWPTLMMWLDPPLILTGCAILLWFGMWRDRGRRDGGRGSVAGVGQPAGA